MQRGLESDESDESAKLHQYFLYFLIAYHLGSLTSYVLPQNQTSLILDSSGQASRAVSFMSDKRVVVLPIYIKRRISFP